MVPSASEITRRRLTAATVLRLFASLVATISVIPFMVLAVEMSRSYFDWRNFDDWVPFLVAITVFLCAGLVIWAIAPLAARIMIRVPRVPVCPNCRYKLEGLMAPQCTECGYTLTPEFMTTPAERAAGFHEPDTVWLRQIATLVMRIGAGLFVPIGVVGSFMTTIVVITEPRWNEWWPVYAWCFGTVFAILVVLTARWLSILFVPSRRWFGKHALNENAP